MNTDRKKRKPQARGFAKPHPRACLIFSLSVFICVHLWFPLFSWSKRMPPKNAVVLLSGGLDSTTTLALAQRDGFTCHALTMQYGQRHAVEVEAARRIAQRFGVARHIIVPIDLRQFGGSALTADVPVPKDRPIEEMSTGIPVTYVPA